MCVSTDLDGSWSLTWTPVDGCSDVPECKAAIEGQVPGDVHEDIVRAGLLPEPLFGVNAPLHEWVERAVFAYEREFNASPGCNRSELVFQGLDCLATVFVDGKEIGSSANAHVPHVFDITEMVSNGGRHTLRVEVDTGVEWAKKQVDPKYRPADNERIFLRKPQFSFKWDWAPRLVTCGIWRGVELRQYYQAAVRDVMLTSRIDGHRAGLTAAVEVEAFEPGDYLLRLRVVRGPAVWQSVEKVRLAGGRNKAEAVVDVDPVEKWWPAGYGDQALYVVDVEVEAAGGEIVDDYSTTYGFRDVKIRQDAVKDGETSFVVNVNGVDVFCKGADWVPADSIVARVGDQKYEALIRAAVEANFNMLRIWGGGIYEDDTFYHLCDRHGIMIWHDFMFACAVYPDDQPSFMENVEDEARKVVRRLRHHPCIAIWCGNNECDWGCSSGFGAGSASGEVKRFYGWSIYHKLLPSVCAELDPQCPYWPSSPFGEETDPNGERCGDRHAWLVSIQEQDLAKRADVRNYCSDRGKFVSEYGVLSYALPQTIADYTGENAIDFSSEAFKVHDNFFNNNSTQGEPLTHWYLKVGFGSVPQDPLECVRQSLAYQAMGYREAISCFRIRKFDCAGSLFWMYSDCWGTLGWTIVDYYLRRKPSFYWVRKAYAPLAVFAKPDGEVVRSYVVNDTLKDLAVQLTLEAGDMSGNGRNVAEELVVPANSVVRGPEIDAGPGYAFARIEKAGAIASEDLILTRLPAEMDVPAVELGVQVRQAGDDVEVTIRPDGFAHFVWLDLPDSAAPTDNYFNVLPNRPRIIRISGCRADQVRVTALNEKRA